MSGDRAQQAGSEGLLTENTPRVALLWAQDYSFWYRALPRFREKSYRSRHSHEPWSTTHLRPHHQPGDGHVPAECNSVQVLSSPIVLLNHACTMAMKEDKDVDELNYKCVVTCSKGLQARALDLERKMPKSGIGQCGPSPFERIFQKSLVFRPLPGIFLAQCGLPFEAPQEVPLTSQYETPQRSLSLERPRPEERERRAERRLEA